MATESRRAFEHLENTYYNSWPHQLGLSSGSQDTPDLLISVSHPTHVGTHTSIQPDSQSPQPSPLSASDDCFGAIMPPKLDQAIQRRLTVNGNGTHKPAKKQQWTNADSLDELQTDEQRRILDTVAQIRKCGLSGVLSLPQLVVCGDQSAGKSSVLEALTEIPFPRNDNLCTRFATEIILRRELVDSLTIKVIPDTQRPAVEKSAIGAFKESIHDFSELPRVMDMAMKVMGMDEANTSTTSLGAFARDVLSIEITGPKQPQLTLVDIPGLIANATKGVTDADVKMVAEITDNYISQPRTICLAVIAATNDHANQSILTKVRKYDPEGERTLGIITKPDRLPAGSGSETAFIALAQNQDVFFKLGWHVLKNRSFEEGESSLMERNMAEAMYFRTSNFKALPAESVGIKELKTRLSSLLFEHVKRELPKLRMDLESALAETGDQLAVMGSRRSTAEDCKSYLSQLSLDFHDVSLAAVEGHYEGEYFRKSTPQGEFREASPVNIARIRAVVQNLNTEFADRFHRVSHKYHIDLDKDGLKPFDPKAAAGLELRFGKINVAPIRMTKDRALEWVANILASTRGRELVGNYNPLLVGELFWEQSSKWELLAKDHIEDVAAKCSQFLKALLKDKCPKDVEGRLWDGRIYDALRQRSGRAYEELEEIMREHKGYPINYNHSYIDSIKSRRENRQRVALAENVANATSTIEKAAGDEKFTTTTVNIDKIINAIIQDKDENMDNFSCEEALDCLFAIYKVSQKVFIANITIQVIERHIVRGLEEIFSPVGVNAMSDAEAEAIAAEPVLAQRQRAFLEDRIEKLKAGHDIFRRVMGSGK